MLTIRTTDFKRLNPIVSSVSVYHEGPESSKIHIVPIHIADLLADCDFESR